MPTKQSMIQAKYDAKNSKVYSLKFNRKTDAEIIEKLDNVESRNGYIKQLIREDLTRTCPGSVPVPLSDATLETLKEKAAQYNISVPDLIKNIVNECIIRDMRKNIDSVPVSVPDSVPKKKKHMSIDELLSFLEQYTDNYDGSMYDLLNALTQRYMCE